LVVGFIGKEGGPTLGDTVAQIVEGFRAAAIGMTTWENALDALSGAVRARIGQLAVVNSEGRVVLDQLSGSCPDAVKDYVNSGGTNPSTNLRMRAILEAPTGRCIAEQDFATPAMLDRCPSYRGFLKRQDVPYSLQAVLARTPSMMAVVGFQRSGSRGHAAPEDYRMLEAVVPALAGIVEASLQVGGNTDGLLLRSAEHLSGPAILLGGDMAILSASESAQDVLRRSTHLTSRAGRLVAVDRLGAAELLRAFLAVSDARSATFGNRAVVLRSSGESPIIVDLCPLPARPSGPLALARALLSIRAPRPAPAPDAVLRDAYGLTAAEAAVALLLATGRDLTEIAHRRGSAVGTVRNQVKALLAKTGSRRQTELIIKLQRLC
jgi:DNA-binding CsgD family transcriptional regulator